MKTVNIKADNKITKALIKIFEAFKLSFDVKNEKEKNESSNKPEFFDMVLKLRNEEGGKLITDDYKKALFQVS
jgi:hypothetical protein